MLPATLTVRSCRCSPRRSAPACSLATATVTKLTRNLCILAVIPLLALWHRSQCKTPDEARTSWTKVVPLFVVGFLAMAGLRTLGDLTAGSGWLTLGAWEAAVDVLASSSRICLILAMAAVGLSTDLRCMRSLGFAPLMVGLAAAVTVGGVSLAMITLLQA